MFTHPRRHKDASEPCTHGAALCLCPSGTRHLPAVPALCGPPSCMQYHNERTPVRGPASWAGGGVARSVCSDRPSCRRRGGVLGACCGGQAGCGAAQAPDCRAGDAGGCSAWRWAAGGGFCGAQAPPPPPPCCAPPILAPDFQKISKKSHSALLGFDNTVSFICFGSGN